MTTSPSSRYFAAHTRTMASVRSQLMQVYVQKIDEHDPPTQLRRSERRRVQPAGRRVETGEATLDGQRSRARMATGAEEAHVRDLRLLALPK